MITPESFLTIPCPTYPEIRLSLFAAKRVKKMIEQARPSAIHIATEGPLGMCARRYCLKNNIPFTTAFHTRFAEYVNARTRLPLSVGYAFLRWFHKPSSTVMVATQSMEDQLKERGFHNISRWTRGIDASLFHPRTHKLQGLATPIFMYVAELPLKKILKRFWNWNCPAAR